MTAYHAIILYLLGFICYLLPIWHDEQARWDSPAVPGTWADVFDALLWPATMFTRADDEFRKTQSR